MSELRPDYFFDLSSFPYKALFEECRFVWEALERLKVFFQNTTLGLIESPIPQGCFLENREQISIGKGCVIEPGALIKGPCIIGDLCHIRHGAYLRGEVLLSKGCVVGHATEVKSSLFFPRAHAPHFNYVGNSILGADTNLGAGFICSNYRLDGKNIKIYFNGEKIETGINKLGIVLGDGSQLGCNGVSNPGTLAGKGCLSRPCSNFGGFFKERSIISSKK